MEKMRFQQLPSNAFSNLQLGAGVICTSFTASTGAISGIIGATSGGVTYSCVPTYLDMADGIDNATLNSKDHKIIDYWTITLSGTFKTVDIAAVKTLLGASVDIDTTGARPAMSIASTDFKDIYWVGDYGTTHSGVGSQFIAIKLENALSTGGFQITSDNAGKGSFAATFTAHISDSAPDTVPTTIVIGSTSSAPQ